MTGDLNAKVAEDNIGYGEIMGRHKLDIANDSQRRLDRICSTLGKETGALMNKSRCLIVILNTRYSTGQVLTNIKEQMNRWAEYS